MSTGRGRLADVAKAAWEVITNPTGETPEQKAARKQYEAEEARKRKEQRAAEARRQAALERSRELEAWNSNLVKRAVAAFLITFSQANHAPDKQITMMDLDHRHWEADVRRNPLVVAVAARNPYVGMEPFTTAPTLTPRELAQAKDLAETVIEGYLCRPVKHVRVHRELRGNVSMIVFTIYLEDAGQQP